MELPIIRVEDSDSTAPALTLRYTRGENDLDLKAISADIYSLLDHPGRACVGRRQNIILCNDVFLDKFWAAAACLLDYFADFYATDTALMQSVWFHLLDTWQRASSVQLYRSVAPYHQTRVIQTYLKDYTETINLIHSLTSSKPHTHPPTPSESIIHDPTSPIQGITGPYTTGPYISGLKPWQQFLYATAPGFTPTPPEPPNTPRTTTGQGRPTCYIPQPAIALIQAHTTRARTLTSTLATKLSWDVQETLASFDAHALPFPSTPSSQTHTYPSPLRPESLTSYHLVQGAPPVRRHEGYADPSMLVETPDLLLLDEAVAMCRGREAWVAMTGPVGSEGVGFDVWSVKGEGGVEGGEMFEEWEFGG